MKTATLILLILPCLLGAQDCMENYNNLMKEAKRLTDRKNPDYQQAIKIYSVANNAAKDCGQDKSGDINQALGALFTKIDGQRKTAEAAQQKAEDAVKKMQAAEAAKAAANKDKAKAEEGEKKALYLAEQRAVEAEKALKVAEHERELAKEAQEISKAAEKKAEEAKATTEVALAKADRVLSRIYFYGPNKDMAISKDEGTKKYGIIDRQGNLIVDYEYAARPEYKEKLNAFMSKEKNMTYVFDQDKRYVYANEIKAVTNKTTFVHLEKLSGIPKDFSSFANAEILVLKESLSTFLKKRRVGFNRERKVFKKIPKEIETFQNLRKLTLKFTDIDLIPEELMNLSTLEYINLSKCTYLKHLPEDWSKLKNLKELELAFCFRLKELPKSISRLPNLEALNIGSCGDAFINDFSMLSQLPNLKKLNASGSQQQETLSETIGLLGNLEVLDLHGWVKLKRLPERIGHLKKLKLLQLYACPELDRLPESIVNLKNLMVLDLTETNCSISYIEKLREQMPWCTIYYSKTK